MNVEKLAIKDIMGEALNEAQKAYEIGEIPIGAVIVKEGEVIARGYNQVETMKDATKHAEMIAIEKASNKIGGWRLSGCTMYVTTEPCTMCAGAILASRIDRLVIGTENPKAGACVSLKNLLQDNRLNHVVEIEVGIRREDCEMIMKKFFKDIRKTKQTEEA